MSVLSSTDLEAIGVGQGDGLDREVRDYYTVIVRVNGQPNTDDVSFTSVSITDTLLTHNNNA